jgi:hypothetical protein
MLVFQAKPEQGPFEEGGCLSPRDAVWWSLRLVPVLSTPMVKTSISMCSCVGVCEVPQRMVRRAGLPCKPRFEGHARDQMPDRCSTKLQDRQGSEAA